MTKTAVASVKALVATRKTSVNFKILTTELLFPGGHGRWWMHRGVEISKFYIVKIVKMGESVLNED